MVIFVLIVVGLALGSFVNALVWRLHEQETRKELRVKSKEHKAKKGSDPLSVHSSKLSAAHDRLSIVTGRSMCLHCGHELAARDLIPVVSWLRLHGKCRYCTAPIPDTPVAELLVPLLFVASYVWWPLTFDSSIAWLVFAGWLASVVCFVALTIYDFKWFTLPDRIVFPLIGLAALQVALLAVNAGSAWTGVVTDAFWGMVIIAGLFYALFTVSDGKWIGGGDVKLALALGLLAGGAFQALLIILLASLSGLVFMLPAMAKGKAGGHSKLPFGPFLLLGTFIVVLFGDTMINWYLGALTL